MSNSQLLSERNALSAFLYEVAEVEFNLREL